MESKGILPFKQFKLQYAIEDGIVADEEFKVEGKQCD